MSTYAVRLSIRNFFAKKQKKQKFRVLLHMYYMDGL